MSHELFLTRRQKTKIRNGFDSNMSTDIKLNEHQTSKMIQSGGSFGSWFGNLGKKALTNVAILFTRDNLPGLVSNIALNAINKFKREISEKGAFFIKNELCLFWVKIWMILLRS